MCKNSQVIKTVRSFKCASCDILDGVVVERPNSRKLDL